MKVFTSISKIQSESKSQHASVTTMLMRKCLPVFQRYNLKANHNSKWICCAVYCSVYQYFKDTIWKQITTYFLKCFASPWVFTSISKIQSESKSQLFCSFHFLKVECLPVFQRYNLKANHNARLFPLLRLASVYQYFKDTIWKQITTHFALLWEARTVFTSISKIQSESKSQLRILHPAIY